MNKYGYEPKCPSCKDGRLQEVSRIVLQNTGEDQVELECMSCGKRIKRTEVSADPQPTSEKGST